MGAAAPKAYNSFRNKLVTGNIVLDAHSFKAALFTSSSNCADATKVKLADLDNEVSGNGYARQDLIVEVSNPTAATVKWDETTNPEFEASGGPIVCRYLVIYDDTPTTPDADPLVCWILLDDTPTDVTIPDGSVLKITIDPDGLITLSGMS